jgi:hypothetical protein
MPVFYFLSQDEAADVYLYLTLYPPYKFAALDPAGPVRAADRGAADGASVLSASLGSDSEPPSTPPAAKDQTLEMSVAPSLGFGLFLTLLLAGGFTFTVRECMRLSGVAEGLGPTRALRGKEAKLETEEAQEDQRLIA